ncbi:SRPBCC family protein [Sesbania bispinosa]|nr:SRPBCC family protein [Sesbania bispinosa]
MLVSWLSFVLWEVAAVQGGRCAHDLQRGGGVVVQRLLLLSFRPFFLLFSLT